MIAPRNYIFFCNVRITVFDLILNSGLPYDASQFIIINIIGEKK